MKTLHHNNGNTVSLSKGSEGYRMAQNEAMNRQLIVIDLSAEPTMEDAMVKAVQELSAIGVIGGGK